ncbi:putative oxidoreductase [Fusarium albosuccineum]|uniref:Putative oxidoreductase n=1 Tax=Fusarium albosuccineum TaxID=1237068 RepID=A0A8H4LB28_9HYPO|nr:putative oxidoreductase [Fusarium albosuccineum]
MPNLFETVFLMGATSGIGEELARQYHARGKKVVISGRRVERLDRLKTELVGIERFQMDIQAIDSIPHKVGQVFEYFPSIDAVIVVAGLQNYYNFNPTQAPPMAGKGAPNTSDINSEITTNFTGPIILTGRS